MKNEFTVKIQNIVAFTALGKPVVLTDILEKVENTEYHPEQFPGLVYRMNNPRAAALIFSQGKIVCTGTKSVKDVKIAMHKIVDMLRGVEAEVPHRFKIKVENIVTSSKIRANLNLEEIAIALENSEYEPEQFPGLVYRIPHPRVAFLLFSSGRIICTGAQNIESVHKALHKFKEELESIGIKVVPEKDDRVTYTRNSSPTPADTPPKK